MKVKRNIHLIIWAIIYLVYGFVDSFIADIPTQVSIPFWSLTLLALIIIEYIKIPKGNVTK
jgi:antibiotic biosynthesis monooxygenase (ABM) superfamily enzyme